MGSLPRVARPVDSGVVPAVASPYRDGISDKAAPVTHGGNLLLLVQCGTLISHVPAPTAQAFGLPSSPVSGPLGSDTGLSCWDGPHPPHPLSILEKVVPVSWVHLVMSDVAVSRRASGLLHIL